jgi:3-phosphoglycerate kinase
MEKELTMLGRVVGDPERPFVAILGGAKVSGKADVIQALLGRVDRLLVGGAMANTFFKALGLEVGASLVEDDRVELARTIMATRATVCCSPSTASSRTGSRRTRTPASCRATRCRPRTGSATSAPPRRRCSRTR